MSGTPLLRSALNDGRLEMTAAGSWTAAHAGDLERLIEGINGTSGAGSIDMRAVDAIDTFGAWLLERLVRERKAKGDELRVIGLPERYSGLIDEVHHTNVEPSSPPARLNPLVAALDSLGRGVAETARDVIPFLQMLGALAMTVLRVIAHPSRFRLTSAVHHLDRVAWQAIPIILLITFLIGGIIAQQGIFHFRKFGAETYVVDMVGILVLREIGVLIVAIMVAGRSGSSYTAELGSMKMREEIDALRTMGHDPVEVLILPRVLALVIALPILAFLGSMAALYGGGLIAWALWRHEPGHLHCPAEGRHLHHPFRGRHHQGAVHGAGDRDRRVLGRPAGEGQRGVARAADHGLGGEVDLPGDHPRWHVRHLLCIDRDVSR